MVVVFAQPTSESGIWHPHKFHLALDTLRFIGLDPLSLPERSIERGASDMCVYISALS